MQLDLFPLHTVLFPHMRLPLHIFEPRYRVMIRACIDEERPFGVALIRSGEEVGGPAEPHGVGTTARITSHETLPDGRRWAGIEAGEVATILDRTADAAMMAPRCRGWWGAPTGPAQVAERAVFAQVGWPLEDMARQVRFRPSGDRWNVEIVAAEAGRAWTVSVEAGRTVPTIACRALGGLPAKPATEFRVTDIWETSR